MRFEHLSDGVAHARIVVDDEDRRRRLPARRLCLRFGSRRWRRRREKIRNDAQNLYRLDRLVEMRATYAGDGPQSLRGNVAGYDDGGNFSMEFLPQLCDDLDAIGPIGKVKIGDDEIGTLCRRKCNDAIGCADRR